jgi:hypothetical protein
MSLMDAVKDEVEHLTGHGQPAAGDATAAAPSPVSALAADVEYHANQVLAWGKKLVEDALPPLNDVAAEAEKIRAELGDLKANPVVQVLESAGLAPAQVQLVAEIVSKVCGAFAGLVHDADEHLDPALLPAPPAGDTAPAPQ